MNKVSIGFQGGGGISVRIDDSTLGSLRDALKSGNDWLDLETADGMVTLKAGEVAYISTDSGEHKVGFSGLGG